MNPVNGRLNIKDLVIGKKLFEKVSGIAKADGTRVGFDYWPNGQMATKKADGRELKAGGYLWDGLALLQRTHP